MFYYGSTMTTPDPTLASALARLEARWGSAAIRLGNGGRIDAPTGGRDSALTGPRRGSPSVRDPRFSGPSPLVEGALAPAILPLEEPDPEPVPWVHLEPLRGEAVSTGFPALDALLGTGGLPLQASAAIRGDASSGKLTLALRCMAEAQARGAIVAFLDLAGIFDPLEAVSRGVDLRWLLVLRPEDPPEGFALAGALLGGRSIDLLVVDLPRHMPPRQEHALRRLAAHARRVGARLIVLEPARSSAPVHRALAESTSLRLELARSGWIRLGRDIVGQRTEVTVAKNRFGPPGRQVELEIHYVDDAHPSSTRTIRHASPPSSLAPPGAPPGAPAPFALRRLEGGRTG